MKYRSCLNTRWQLVVPPAVCLPLVFNFLHTDHRRVNAAELLLGFFLHRFCLLQIRLPDYLSQLQYKGKRLTSIIYISQPLYLGSLVILEEERYAAEGPAVPGDPL